MKIKTAIENIGQMLFPNHIKCVACNRELFEYTRYELCPKCLEQIEFNYSYCVKCGRKIVIFDSIGSGACKECLESEPAFTRARSPIVYSGIGAKLIKHFKYGSGKFLAPVLAEYMFDSISSELIDDECDFVTYIPMHIKKQKARGYNQSELLAKEVAKYMALPCIPILQKSYQTLSQASLNRGSRLKNLRNSLSLDKYYMQFMPQGKSILLIDDVLTTGATANIGAELLKSAGFKNIYVLTFASVPYKLPENDDDFKSELAKQNLKDATVNL